jgi:AraC family transcriptional regulator
LKPLSKEINQTYLKRLNTVFVYIENNLHKEINLEDLSSVSYFSKFHFIRLFTSLIGETPFEYIKRLRLEKAAVHLKVYKSKKIQEIAFFAGYSDVSVFSRTFAAYYKVSPTKWRKHHTENSNISQTTSETSEYLCSKLKNKKKMEQLLNSEVKIMPNTQVAFIRHIGDYSKLGNEYVLLLDKLYNWASRQNLNFSSLMPLIIHHDDPSLTPSERQRTSVCLTIPQQTEVKAEGEIGLMEVAGGKHLVARFLLRPEEIYLAWDWIYAVWFPTSSYQPGDDIPYQLYPEPFKDGKLTIDFCIPVKPI